MLQVVHDFEKFEHLPRETRWQKRIFQELRYLQTLSDNQNGIYDSMISQALNLLTVAQNDCGTITNQTAEAAEQLLLPAAQDAKSYEFLCVGHAHIDMNWMWGYDETINTVIDTFRTMLQIMKEYPTFTFAQSQASTYRILEQYAPEMLEEVKARVAEGRWELTATNWVETDKNMANGESLSRHILYTKKYLADLFSIDPDSLEVDFNPDTFGHSRNVPEIASEGGLKYYYHCRGRVGESILNRWRAPSGAELIVYTEPSWYNGEILPVLAESAVRMAEITGSKTLLKVYGVGDHGGGPTRRDLDLLIEMNSWPVYPKFTFSSFHHFFHTVEERRETLPVLEDEINFLCDGCYTTQSKIKAGNRGGERALQDAELFDALAVVRAGARPNPEIFAEAWKKVLFNQFHDIIPGSGVTETREYASGLYQQALGAAAARRKNAFYQLSQKINTESLTEVSDVAFSRGEGGGPGFGGIGGGCGHNAGKTRVYHMFNASPWERSDVSEFVVWDYEGDSDRLAVKMPEGEWLDTQILEKSNFWGHDFVRILASVTVPACGWTTVLVGEKPVQPTSFFFNDMRTQRPESFVLENELVRAEFNPATCGLRSFINKKNGRELIPEGREGRFELATEAVWKEVTGWGGGMSAWFAGRQKEVKPLTKSEMRMLAGGSQRQQLELSMPFGNSKMQVVVSLDRNSTALKYKAVCEWREFGSDENGVPALQFTMPTVCAGEKFLYDVPCSFKRRKGWEMDMPANRFVAADDGEDALLLSAKTKYGYRTANGRVGVTMIRGAYNPDLTPEIGHHEIEFCVCAAPGGKTNLEYAKLVQDYEHPVYTVTGGVHGGDLPAANGFVELVSGNAWLSGVKISEDKKAVILRLYETEEQAQTISLRCGFAPSAVSVADQLERPVSSDVKLDQDVITLDIKPNQLRILRLDF